MRREPLFIAALFLGIACSDDLGAAENVAAEPAAAIPAESPAPPAPDDLPTTEADPAVGPPEEAVEALADARDAILFGDIYMIQDNNRNDYDEPGAYTLLIKMAPQPQPTRAPVGWVAVHAGQWEIRVIRELSSPFEHVSVIDSGDVCEASVVGARELHATEAPGPNNDGSPQSWTFLGLELTGCDGGSIGVAGTPVTVHVLRREQMRVPASPELISLVRTQDDELGWEDPIPAANFRMLQFPRRGISVVVGSAAWVVRNGVVLDERFHGYPSLLIEAGRRTFFGMSAPSEDWSASLEDFLPPSASCVVEDASGSPLNVRNSPRSRAQVIDTLENDTPLRVVETRGGWRRIEGRGQAWVHESGLRCPLAD